jgi:hypothetical protein
MSAKLGGYAVHPSWWLNRDELYALDGGGALVMHPLAVAQIEYPNPLDRLPVALGILRDRAHARLDAAIRTLSTTPTPERSTT